MLKTAGVVTIYYPEKSVWKNIESYYEEVDYLVVVDNTPEKGNAKYFKNMKKVEYIAQGKNLGVSKALNIGAKKAIEKGYHWLLTMDQDTTIKSSDIKKIKKYIETNDMSKVGIVTPWHKTKLEIAKPKDPVDHPVDVMTSGNFLNLDVYQKIGGFKDWMFIDGVDMEYCLNLGKEGYRIDRITAIEIEHDLGDIKYVNFFGKRLLCTNHNAFRRYFMIRNYHYLFDMYVDYNPEFCNMAFPQKRNIIKSLLFEKDKLKKLKNSWRGYRDYKKGYKGEYPFKH